jgi:hypothetical protein
MGGTMTFLMGGYRGAAEKVLYQTFPELFRHKSKEIVGWEYPWNERVFLE